jgi:cysteine desulfurase
MMAALGRGYGNPGSLHHAGRAARALVEDAREAAAALIGAEAREIIFTAGASEANNLAIAGMLSEAMPEGPVVVSGVEHPSVIIPARAWAQRSGRSLIVLPVDAQGRLDLDAMAGAIPGAALVSVQWVNHETGVMQDIAALAARCRRHGVPLHCDATQAAGKLPIDLRSMGIDLLTFSAHKMGGPPGAGALFMRHGLRIVPQLLGGPQESGRRAGTENAAAIAGFGVACALARRELATFPARLRALREEFEAMVLAEITGALVNGADAPRAPHVSNIAFPGHDAEDLLYALDARGIAVSTGAACSSGATDPSPVLLAMGQDHARARSALRFSFGVETTREALAFTASALRAILKTDAGA